MKLNFSEAVQNKKYPWKLSMCCPWCESRVGKIDNDFKLSIDLRAKIYNCYRCGASPSTTGKLNFDEFNLRFDNPEKQQEDKILNGIRTKILGLFNIKAKTELDLDKFSYPVSKETPMSLEYLNKRKITTADIQKYNIRSGKSFTDNQDKTINRWRGRVIFPFYENGKVIFAVGRSYTGEEPRYLNSEGDRETVVYGIDEVTDRCIICEGIISKIAAEKYSNTPAVATLGKFITDTQIEKIKSKCSAVYLCYDGDVDLDHKKNTIKRLLSAGFEVWNISLPKDKDPDDLKEEFKIYFDSAKKITLFNLKDVQ